MSVLPTKIECISFKNQEKWEIKDVPLLARKLINITVDEESNLLYTGGYREILGISGKKVIGKKLSEIEPEAKTLRVLRTGRPLRLIPNVIHSLRKVEVLATIIPLYERNKMSGAQAFFLPVSSTELVKQLTSDLRFPGLNVKKEKLSSCKEIPLFSGKKLVGCSPSHQRVIELALKASLTDYNTLLRGESGVGKELLAELIHLASPRRNNKFVRVNCAAIPETLLESELFGYAGGAFTGANAKGKPGKFELAAGGTLFLDEIGDMSLPMQAKVLRVLQEKEIERVGATKPQNVNVRVIAATSQELEQMIEQGRFRRDLYYRLNVVPLYIPSLRERKEDLELLITYFTSKIFAENSCQVNFSREIVDVLLNYQWPGNVRELENLVKYAVVLGSGDGSLEPGVLLANLWKPGQKVSDPDVVKIEPGLSLDKLWSELEAKAIRTTLNACRYNKSRACNLLGISRRTLYLKAEKYGISL